ncbi:MAG: homoserine O-succinyltransferase [Myxococcales bacterium]|nr:homoserine O-succinyltransferase [Myxococcales bacterium]
MSRITVESNRPEPYCTSGTSPTDSPLSATSAPARRHLDVVRPATLHLIGPGQVGRELLELLAETPYRLIGLTDSTATIKDDSHFEHGLDARALAALKRNGVALSAEDGARRIGLAAAIAWVGADIVIDATASDAGRRGWAEELELAALGAGARLAFAAKDAVLRRAARWVGDGRVGINAVLGGTGSRLADEIEELRQRTVSVAIAGNASTTIIIEAIEAGGSLEEGLAIARQRGVLEPDPELDLRGDDAALKLALVAAAVFPQQTCGRGEHVARPDLRDVDAQLIRQRAARGATTRLVGRVDRSGRGRLAYEEVPRASTLDVPSDRVVYAYQLDGGERRVHVAGGVGARRTAEALLDDVHRLAGRGAHARQSGASARLDDASRLFHLEALCIGDAALDAPRLAYELHGDARAPLVIVAGGISAGRHVFASSAASARGWWQDIAGADRVLDPRRYHLLSVDFIGGAGASSGPASGGFPRGATPSADDQARAIIALLDTLGIERVHAFVGASYGGQIGLALAPRLGARLERLVVISAADAPHPRSSAWRVVQRRIVELAQRAGDEAAGLGLARALAMTTYRGADELRERFADGLCGEGETIEAYLDAQGERFVARFDAEAFLALSRSIDISRADASRIRHAVTTLIAASSDELVPETQIAALAERVTAPVTLRRLESRYGHDAFLKEPDALGAILQEVLA